MLIIALVILGLINSVTVLFVLHSKVQTGKTELFQKLSSLVDITFLLAMLVRKINENKIFMNVFICTFVDFTTHTSGLVSSLMLVASVVDRSVVVAYPSKMNAAFSAKIVCWSFVLLILFSICLNIPVIHFTVPSEIGCRMEFRYDYLLQHINFISTVISFIIPVVVLLVSNATTAAIILCRIHNKNNVPDEAAEMTPEQQRQDEAVQRNQKQSYMMLLITITVFIALNGPISVIRITAYIYNINEDNLDKVFGSLKYIAEVLYIKNFCVNVYVYYITDKKFRTIIYKLITTHQFFRRRPPPTPENVDEFRHSFPDLTHHRAEMSGGLVPPPPSPVNINMEGVNPE